MPKKPAIEKSEVLIDQYHGRTNAHSDGCVADHNYPCRMEEEKLVPAGKYLTIITSALA